MLGPIQYELVGVDLVVLQHLIYLLLLIHAKLSWTHIDEQEEATTIVIIMRY